MSEPSPDQGPSPAAGPAPVVRSRLALALDVDDLVDALRLARELRPYFGVVKVGLELYSAAGPDAVLSLTELGFEVFADLKLHDIPTTVGRAARVLGALGVGYLNLHACGGVPMLRAGVEGLAAGAERADAAPPVALGVTVLTSDADASPLAARVVAAMEAGCGGVVCAAPDLVEVRRLAPNAIAVVPGTRPPGSPAHDQVRVATPAEAFAGGADLVVIGRAVTAAPDRVAAARAILAGLGEAPWVSPDRRN